MDVDKAVVRATVERLLLADHFQSLNTAVNFAEQKKSAMNLHRLKFRLRDVRAACNAANAEKRRHCGLMQHELTSTPSWRRIGHS